jgi:hypothetical protein
VIQAEMREWWQRNGDIDQGGYSKEEIEDYTGRIPLLLDSCLMDGKVNLNTNAFNHIYEQAVAFVARIKNPTRQNGRCMLNSVNPGI